ncbi:Uncharacterized protein involved in exopolysaccharide biosynthesis [Loktanella atrilutea]|uniref:Uncharacterized protein involved in exopolysaccharide biosynthesis n=1 Tax=Loktanella atrilutea TaxID=366533 RepID=A0A1M4XLE6_LOKAT|nr:hypothetical protein [Loktanella atrilutea]SHE94256.1 Uncharacterized protein involved in exopolysaccharide biosynthesis [Loktanella atrilutea]
MSYAPADTTLIAPRPKPAKGRIRRAIVGGRLGDLGRLPRYAAFALLGGAMIWAPITGYLRTAPLKYKSSTSLILPGSGASASLNLNGIGQASSSANSAFSSNAVSPTETYKRLLAADRILAAAARSLDISQGELGQPRVELVDQTSLIHFEMTGGSPEDAQARGEAILTAFFRELDALRADEVNTREDSSLQAIADYRDSVGGTRAEISRLQDETGLLSVKQYDVLLDRNLALETEIRSRAAALADADAAVAAMSRQLGLDPLTAARTLKLYADGSYLALLDDIARFEAAHAEASAHYGPAHPKVVAARDGRDKARTAALQLASATTGLDIATLATLDLAPQGARAELLSDLVRKDVDRAGLKQELTTLKAQHAEGQADLNRKAAAAAQLQDLERDFSVAEAVFASAIARAQSSKSDVYASYPLVQVLENPSLADRPSSPNRKLAIAAGIAATLMMLMALAMGWVRLALISRLLSKTPVAA